jgi:tetratricopeptide (TPR) repeat protein
MKKWLLELLEKVEWTRLRHEPIDVQTLAAIKAVYERLKAGELNNDEAYTALHLFGESDYFQAIDEVEKALESTDPDLREIALNVLGVHWTSEKHRPLFERVVLDTKEEDEVRAVAARGLGVTYFGKRDSALLELLLSIVRNADESDYLRDGAYDALLDIWGVSPAIRLPTAKPFDPNTDFDWKLIDMITESLKKNP